jgi:hypothetical protein
LNSVTYGNELFVVVGDAGVVLMSEDGITWKQQSSPSAAIMYSVTYGKSRFLAVGEYRKSFKIEPVSKISLIS